MQNQEVLSPQSKVNIEVKNPEQRSQIIGVNKFVVYSVKGTDSKGQIDINRRYSDFHLLREILLKRWPGCYIPSLPQKKTIGSNEHIFVQSRRRGLELFLRQLATNEVVWLGEEVQLFMRNTSDSEKVLNPLLKEGLQKLEERYKTLFQKYEDSEAKDTALSITEFSSYLKDSKIVLQKLTGMTQKMYDSSKKNLQKKLMLVEFLLPDYQKNCLLQNDQKQKTQNLLFLCSKNNGISQAIQKYKQLNQYPPVLLIQEEVKREKRQIESFQELIKHREQFESMKQKAIGKVKDLELEGSKINAGKESLLSKIKKQSKEEQLGINRKELEKAKDQEKQLVSLCRIITNMIATVQIAKFKQIRQKAYYTLLKNFAKEERELAAAEKDIWTKVGKHDWIAVEDENSIIHAFKREVQDYEGNLQMIGEGQKQEEGEEQDHADKDL